MAILGVNYECINDQLDQIQSSIADFHGTAASVIGREVRSTMETSEYKLLAHKRRLLCHQIEIVRVLLGCMVAEEQSDA